MNKTKRGTSHSGNESNKQASIYNPDFLLKQARWIRDDLDSQVARDGPDALHSDDILTLDEFLRRLLTSHVRIEDIRFSRIHLAIGGICGQATRWPTKLIDRADQVRTAWEIEHGPLKKLTPPLYEAGGRLYGICKPEDLSKEKLIIKWLKAPGVKLSPLLSRRVGDLGFKPGDWWISPLFAFRDGIIDSAEQAGGIVADADGAYAVLMTDEEEVSGPSPDAFTYRARSQDRGRYRLTAATRESRQPVRILRSHSLMSFWAPKGGVRYDGLHVVTGWAVTMDPKKKEMVYEINFKRLGSEPSIDVVLRRPFSDEVEDYREYKRLRQMVRAKLDEVTQSKAATSPTLKFTSDGTTDEDDVDTSENELHDSFTQNTTNDAYSTK